MPNSVYSLERIFLITLCLTWPKLTQANWLANKTIILTFEYPKLETLLNQHRRCHCCFVVSCTGRHFQEQEMLKIQILTKNRFIHAKKIFNSKSQSLELDVLFPILLQIPGYKKCIPPLYSSQLTSMLGIHRPFHVQRFSNLQYPHQRLHQY
jgi:hypothetical protein